MMQVPVLSPRGGHGRCPRPWCRLSIALGGAGTGIETWDAEGGIRRGIPRCPVTPARGDPRPPLSVLRGGGADQPGLGFCVAARDDSDPQPEPHARRPVEETRRGIGPSPREPQRSREEGAAGGGVRTIGYQSAPTDVDGLNVSREESRRADAPGGGGGGGGFSGSPRPLALRPPSGSSGDAAPVWALIGDLADVGLCDGTSARCPGWR